MDNNNHQDEKPPSLSLPKEDEDPGETTTRPVEDAQAPEQPKPSLLKRLKNKFNRLLTFKNSNSIEEDVAELIEEHDPEGTQIGSEERSILHNVLGMSDSKVSTVMIPRTDIIAVEDTISLKDLHKTMIKNVHTRTPVYKGSLDNVIGFIHIKDLLPIIGSKKSFNISSIIREILYVPPSMKILDLLVKMRAKRVHMALVLDEYGGTDGLVTMEDLVEEIVGEIEDEHDEVEEEEIKKIHKNEYEVSARVPVEDLEKKLGVNLKSEYYNEDFDTIGGLIFFILGHVPTKGETVHHPCGYTFEVIDADERRVKKLLVKK